MGFDNYFNQDHCYLEDCRKTEQIACNMDITSSNRKEKCDTSLSHERNKVNEAHIIIRNQGVTQSSKNNNQQVVYLPLVEVCTEHEDLFLLEDEKLVKPGDKFKSHNDFVQYINENAKRWFYYYKCHDSRRPNTIQEVYLYTCVYLKNKEKYVKKGLRKRTNKLKTDCPCKIKIRHLPHEKELTVVFVCNHHDHPLSEEEFYKLQHGRRLPPQVKEEILDLLTLQIDLSIIRKYVEVLTGFNMTRSFFYAMERSLKSRNTERHISDERLRTLTDKIQAFDHQIKSLNPAQSINNPKKSSVKRRNQLSNTAKNKKSRSHVSEEIITESETLESVRHLQESVKCEAQHNPWITDQSSRIDQSDIKINPIQNLDYENHRVGVIFPDNIESSNEIISVYETLPNRNEIDNGSDNFCIAYETVISEIDNHNVYDDTVISEYVNSEQVYNDSQIDVNNDDELSNNECTIQPDEISYVNDTEIEYLMNNGSNEDIHNDNGHDENNANEIIAQDMVNNGDLDDDLVDKDNETNGVIVEELCSEHNDVFHHDHGDSDIQGDEIVIEDTDNVIHGNLHNGYGDNDNVADEEIVEYDIDNSGASDSTKNNAKDAQVQTCDSKQSPLLPVFDVCVKDGHVTGFIVNDEVMSQLKNDRVDKAVQTEQINNRNRMQVAIAHILKAVIILRIFWDIMHYSDSAK